LIYQCDLDGVASAVLVVKKIPQGFSQALGKSFSSEAGAELNGGRPVLKVKKIPQGFPP